MPTDRNALLAQLLDNPKVVKIQSGARDAIAWCPRHPDEGGDTPNLRISRTKLVVYCDVCQWGGSIEDLAKEWGIVVDLPPWEREIDKLYDYQGADGELRFQVVRFMVAPGAKKQIVQRKRDPDHPGRWIWKLERLRPSLYRLPELRAADLDEWVWMPEGEKDVDRLRSHGLVATTNPMGAGKWRAHFNNELKGRKVAILRDYDDAGKAHRQNISESISGLVEELRCPELPGLAKGGDVSDWLDQGHTVEELAAILDATPRYEATTTSGDPKQNGHGSDWSVSKYYGEAASVTELFMGHGFFVKGDDERYFFDRDQRKLIVLDKEELSIRTLLLDRYRINRHDQLFSNLVEHLTVEAALRGNDALVRQLNYYDVEKNTVLLDMGHGRVLRIGVDEISVRDNGEDGVLFAPLDDHEPWDYMQDPRPGILYDTLVKPANFSNESVFSVQESKAMLLMWMLSMAFGSMMPAKPIALAVGPNESGKSSLFRYIGQMLIGPDFDVDRFTTESKGEDEFWTNVTNSAYVAYDNVDQYIKWMADTLAVIATGVRYSKRKSHTTNTRVSFRARAFLAVTARTPAFSLRREDVAGRTLLFQMETLPEKRNEYEIALEIRKGRNELLSEYAQIIQKALKVPMSDVVVSDTGMRLADFARIAIRISMGLNKEIADVTSSAFAKMRQSQFQFATEEDELVSLLEIWLPRNHSESSSNGSMNLGVIPNNGRKVLTSALLKELNLIADEFGMRLHIDSPEALGRRFKNLAQALETLYTIESGRGRIGAGNGTWMKIEAVLSESTT